MPGAGRGRRDHGRQVRDAQPGRRTGHLRRRRSRRDRVTPAVTGPTPPTNPYVSRGGLKLRHALERFGLSPAGLRCVDVGCSTGGFTDCLLQAGAAHVTAIDTGYGVIAWRLRTDPRVTVLERTNAL
ncbi:MAG: hypothetical protein KIT68_13060, partial [Phycisphaeraceae bacterium]|nr:hypothetical protein [Phycisphaeraceae bacterium]